MKSVKRRGRQNVQQYKWHAIFFVVQPFVSRNILYWNEDLVFLLVFSFIDIDVHNLENTFIYLFTKSVDNI